MGPKTKELIQTLEKCIELLNKHKESFWAEKLNNSLKQLNNGDFYGIGSLLSLFGGMGSFNDLSIFSINGHTIKSEDEKIVNEELDSLRSRIYDLTISIKKEWKI